MDITIENLKAEHSEEVLRIYEEGVKTGDATFVTTTPTWAEWDESHLLECRLVAVGSRQDVLGWAALTPVSGRCVSTGVAEASVYVKAAVRGLGVGKALLETLAEESEIAGFWTLEANTFAENKLGIALLRSCGFRQVGYRERIGKIEGNWKNVFLFERRSKVAGT
jgi:phosphinothricin acetyltransferase